MPKQIKRPASNNIDNETKPGRYYNNSPCIDTSMRDSSVIASILIYISNLPKVDKHDVNALEQRFQECLAFCTSKKIRLLNKIVYSFLGLSKDDVYNMEHSRYGFGQNEREFIQKVKSFCATAREYDMADGQINPIIGMFWQKCYDGMIETQKIEITTENKEELSTDDILKRIAPDMPIDVECKEVNNDN